MWVLAKVMTGFVEQKGRARQGQIPLFHSATCWVRALSAELCGLIQKLWIHSKNHFYSFHIHRTLGNSALYGGKFTRKGAALLIFAAVPARHSPVRSPSFFEMSNRKLEH